MRDGTVGFRFSGYKLLGFKLAGLYRQRQSAKRFDVYRNVQPWFDVVTGTTFVQFHVGRRTFAIERRKPVINRHLHNFAG